MALVLYDHPLSPYTQKVKIALLEKGVEFEAPMPDGIGTGISVVLEGLEKDNIRFTDVFG